MVVGSGRPYGIGQAAAHSLAKMGMNVAVADLTTVNDQLVVDGVNTANENMDALSERVKEIESLGSQGLAVGVDVTKIDQIDKCVSAVVDRFGKIDVLVYNSAVTVGAAPFLKTSSEGWDINYQVNLKGAVEFCRRIVPSMQKAGGGSIVATSSQYAVKVLPGESPYVSSKAGLIAFIKSLASEFAGDNIRANCVCPGAIDTMMARDHKKYLMSTLGMTEQEVMRNYADECFMDRMGHPREVGDVIAFLASEAASFVTGTAIPVDGGAKVGL